MIFRLRYRTEYATTYIPGMGVYGSYGWTIVARQITRKTTETRR